MKSTDKNSQEYTIFKQASKTYFTASIFFPAKIKEEIFSLYAFVRTADNLVDKKDKSYQEFLEFKEDYLAHTGHNPIVANFLKLEAKHKFDPEWTKAFLDSMEIDFCLEEYQHIDELNRYIYGSAEVIGLYIARILELPVEANQFAQSLGKAMQLANFIRDIHEDQALGRTYIPQEDLAHFGLADLQDATVEGNEDAFKNLIHYEIARYHQWQAEAEAGYKYLPKKLLVPIKTAADIYKWTIDKISRDPLVIYRRQVKPNKVRILIQALKNLLLL